MLGEGEGPGMDMRLVWAEGGSLSATGKLRKAWKRLRVEDRQYLGGSTLQYLRAPLCVLPWLHFTTGFSFQT